MLVSIIQSLSRTPSAARRELHETGDGKADADDVARIDAEDTANFLASAITFLELARAVPNVQRRDADPARGAGHLTDSLDATGVAAAAPTRQTCRNAKAQGRPMSACASAGPRGTLFLVVGPSGAGKDSLIAAARSILEPRGTHAFPQRVITRPADAGGEDHIHSTPADFAATAASGGFALAWGAHGLNYGVPRDIEEELAAGRHVVANVSRTVLETARANHAPVRILYVTAPPAILAKRLTARGREKAADVAARLERAGTAPPAGNDVVVLNNDSSLEVAVADFLAALTD